MWAIFEGSDGSGKSSLAEAVAERIRTTRPDEKVEVHHKGPPEGSVLKAYYYDYEDFRPGDHHIISDRHHLGELVYAQIYRKQGPYGALGKAGFRWTEMFIMARGARTFFVDQPVDILDERVNQRGDTFIDIKDLARIRNRYLDVEKEVASSSGIVMPEGDTTEIQDYVIEAGLAYAHFSTWTAAVPSYVGHTQPSAVLVGEKRGGKPPYETRGAFMPTGRGNSGTYLLEALTDPFWKSVGLVNGLEDDPGLVRASVPTARFVALGAKASKRLTQGSIPHGLAPHPQYVKRFHNKMQAEYGQFLEDVAYGKTEGRLSWPN
jgi:thymidylate kinase